MGIETVLKLECCEPNFIAKNKEEALRNITKLLKRYAPISKISDDIIYKALKKREDASSTGFENGIAIPHSQIDGLNEFVVGLFINKNGMDFNALDHKKTKIFVVIIGPHGEKNEHLKLLAQTSRILKEPNAIENILNQSTKIGLYEEFLRNANPNIPKTSKKEKNKLMILTIRDMDILQDISEIFVEYGIEEATSINSEEMENILAKTPLFFGFFNFTGSQDTGSKTIFIKINKDHIQPLINEFEEIFGDLDLYSGLSIMVLDVAYEKGM
jgi:PTS system nitrogen regulatory IIA component